MVWITIQSQDAVVLYTVQGIRHILSPTETTSQILQFHNRLLNYFSNSFMSALKIHNTVLTSQVQRLVFGLFGESVMFDVTIFRRIVLSTFSYYMCCLGIDFCSNLEHESNYLARHSFSIVSNYCCLNC